MNAIKRGCLFRWALLIIVVVVTLGSQGNAQPTGGGQANGNAAPNSEKPGAGWSKSEERVYQFAERAIESADRSLQIVVWLLGVLVGGTAVGVFVLYRRLSKFLGKAKEELRVALANLSDSTQAYEQLMRNIPLLLSPSIDEDSQVVAISTLAQLRRPELRSLFCRAIRSQGSAKVQAAAVYAVRLLGSAGREALVEVLAASKSADAMLRRECARAISALGSDCREAEDRLEEMRGDADTVVQSLAAEGLAGLRKV